MKVISNPNSKQVKEKYRLSNQHTQDKQFFTEYSRKNSAASTNSNTSVSTTATLCEYSPGKVSHQYNYTLSPGPALAAFSVTNVLSTFQEGSRLFARNTKEYLKRLDFWKNSTSNSSSSIILKMSEEKGKIAAAALEASEHVPLPLKKPIQQLKSEEIQLKLARGEPIDINEYRIDKDDGLITCVCGSNEDDGFTIQCDSCYRWIHASCYNIEDIDLVPDYFECDVCKQIRSTKDVKRSSIDTTLNSNDTLKTETITPISSTTASKDARENITSRSKSRSDSTSVSSTSTDKNNDQVESASGDKSSKSANNRRDSEIDDTQNSSNNNSNRQKQGKGNNNNNQDNKQGKQSNKQVSGPPNGGIIQRVKLKQSKDMHSAIYFPLTENEYVDKYVEEFVRNHSDDDWIIYRDKFENAEVEIKPYKEEKQFSGVPKLGCFFKETRAEKGDLIHEIVGEIDYQRKYIMDPRNQYRIWGTAKPKVIFHPHWPIYIDNRLNGNNCRYIRRSCHPNVELVTVKVGRESKIKYILRALKAIEVGEELSIHWGWDLQHPIRKLVNNDAIEDIPEAERYFLIHSIESILSFGECACSNNKDCYLRMVKKYYNQLFRKNKTKMNNKYKLNEIMFKPKNKDPKQSSILLKMCKEALDEKTQAQTYYTEFLQKKAEYLDNLEKLKNGIIPSTGIDGNVNSDSGLTNTIANLDDAGENTDSTNNIEISALDLKNKETIVTYKMKLINEVKSNNSSAINKEVFSKSEKSDARDKLSLNIHTDPIDDENVKDIESLPIPIQLKPFVLSKINIILENGSKSGNSSRPRTSFSSTAAHSHNISNSHASSHGYQTVFGLHGSGPSSALYADSKKRPLTPENRNASPNIPTGMGNSNNNVFLDSRQNSITEGEPVEKKKKLSFADYRKKSKPT